jgi:hypothetical protein
MKFCATAINCGYLSPLPFIWWGASQVLFFFFLAMKQFDLPIIQKNETTEVLFWSIEFIPFAPTEWVNGGKHLPNHVWEKWGAIGESLLSGTWQIFALTLTYPPPSQNKKKKKKEKLACRVDCPLSKWKVSSGESTLHTETQLKTHVAPNHKKTREAPSFHDVTSHRLHGNSIPKIGCY